MENENKMYAQPMYKCAICGTVHESIPARIQCETKCYQKQELEAKKAAEAKKKEEQKSYHDKVDQLVEDAVTAIMDYTDKYGHYEYNGKLADEMELPELLKMMRYLMF